MGEERKIVCHLSAAPTVGAEFITNGRILDFNSVYPTAITSLYGIEGAVRCDTFVRKVEDSGSLRQIPIFPIFFNPFKPLLTPDKLLRRTELVIRYEHGSSAQRFTQDDLPIRSNPLLSSALKFSSNRTAESDQIEALALWSPGKPLYQAGNFKILDPWFGIGFRVIHIQLSNDLEDGNPPDESSLTSGAATLAVRASLIEYHRPDFGVALLAGGSLLVGGFFGFAGYAALRFELPLKKSE